MIRRDSSDETTSDEESDTEEEQEEEAQGNGERIWPGTRDKATRRGIGQGTHKNEPGDIKRAKHVNKIGKEGRQQDIKTITCKDNNGTHENEPGDIKQAKYANKIGKEGWQQDAKTITGKDNNTKDTTTGDTNAKEGYKRPTEEKEKENEASQGGGKKNKDRGAGMGGKEKGRTAEGASGCHTEIQGAGLDSTRKGTAAEDAMGSNTREGLAIHSQLTCRWCQRTFHKSSGLSMHICHGLKPARRVFAPGREDTEDDNGKTINAQDNNAKHIDAKDNKGGNSYPLGDPRPEEAPDFEHGTVVQSTGADGSIVQTLNVMDKAPHSQHLGDDGSVTAKTVTAEDITAKDPAKKLAKDPDKKNSTKTLTEEHAKDHNARKLTETLAEKFANDHIEAIEPRQGIQRARDITAKTITTKR